VADYTIGEFERMQETIAQQAELIERHAVAKSDAVSARASVTVDAGVFACDCVEHVHPEYGVGMFFTADALQALYTAPPSPDAELVGLLTGLVEIASKRNRGRRGSPNHGHSMPGIWDSDNGDLAGKPCAECALYDLAVDKLADLRKGES
jgi:hypothetical protein